MNNNSQAAPKIEILSKRIEERPLYHEFTKNDFLSPCHGMANLNYDPFPDAAPHDIVRREIICRELVLFAKLKGEVYSINTATNLLTDGHTFTVIKATISFADSTAEIEASEFQDRCEPLVLLAKLRQLIVENQPVVNS